MVDGVPRPDHDLPDTKVPPMEKCSTNKQHVDNGEHLTRSYLGPTPHIDHKTKLQAPNHQPILKFKEQDRERARDTLMGVRY